MRSLAILSGLAALASISSASIYGIAVPETIAPGSTFAVIIETEDFIQSVQDVAIAFGFSPASSSGEGALGNLLSSRYLGPDESNITNNITHYVTLPCKTPKGPVTFTGSLFNLIGAAYSPNINDFTVNVTVAKSTSSTYVSSS